MEREKGGKESDEINETEGREGRGRENNNEYKD